MGSKLNTYGVGNVDLTAMMYSENALTKGFHQASLTNWSTTAVPQIALGSLIECDGALYQSTIDESIGGSTADGTLYIKTVPSSNSVTYEFSTTAPTWDTSKQGWYTSTASNERYLNFYVVRSTSEYFKYNYPNQVGDTLPVGTILDYASTLTPLNYLLCYGQGVLKTEYSKLYGVIGVTFGSTDATHFSVPDFRGRQSIGMDNLGGTSANRVTSAQADTIGGVAGSETASLNIVGTGLVDVYTGSPRYSPVNFPIMNPYVALNKIIKYI